MLMRQCQIMIRCHMHNSWPEIMEGDYVRVINKKSIHYGKSGLVKEIIGTIDITGLIDEAKIVSGSGHNDWFLCLLSEITRINYKCPEYLQISQQKQKQ